MSKRKTKPAPRASFTLRDTTLPDWRWPVPEKTRVYMRARVSIGMPEEMREAWDEAKATRGESLSEIGRRMSAHFLASFRRTKQ